MRQRMPGDRGRSRPAGGHDDDHGFTSVELIVAMSVMALIMVITGPIVSTVFTVSNGVKASYATVNQVLPATTVLERLIRSAASPAPALGQNTDTGLWVPQNPTVGGTPAPPFAPVTMPVQSDPRAYQAPSNGPFVMSPNSMSFYSNTGDINGPELVQVTTTAIPGTSLYRFEATATRADSGSCPTTANLAQDGYANGTVCTYLANPAKTLIDVTTVLNGAAASATPIFQYSTQVPTTQNSGVPTAEAVGTLNASCTATSCPADQVTFVHVHLTTTVGSGGAPTSFDAWVSLDSTDNQSLTPTTDEPAFTISTSSSGSTASVTLTPIDGSPQFTVSAASNASQVSLTWPTAGSYVVTYCQTNDGSTCATSPISEVVSFSPAGFAGLTNNTDFLFTVEQNQVTDSARYSEEVG